MRDIGRDEEGRVIPHERDEQIAQNIAMMVAAGYKEAELCVFFGIRPGKLRQCYGNELKNGKMQHDMQVVAALHMTASTPGNTDASKFWLKARAGWSENESDSQKGSALNIHIHL